LAPWGVRGYAVRMFRILIPALTVAAVLLATPALAETIYRWVDGSGQMHYSDVPREGAERLELDPAQTFSAPTVARPSSPPEQIVEESVMGYEALEISSPSQEETIWNTGGVITVAVRPKPSLMEGHSVNIYYDGKLIESKAARATSAQLSEVYRGEHRITAEILDAAGAVVQAASPITFFYRQTSVLNGQGGFPGIPVQIPQ
jgi:hypothetical protein